ncbi:ABC transporter family substrate-binding protein [Corynebacterium sp.]|uniref:ABC transporter family substrate-binding protein n=1 Tax=Corynebacterium sp. TaxID=1720 RepID=UPI0026DFD5E8|nr:ABC transporter family substrate-binding protein [Corynebacterium sp.]MDO5513098.1 ABC transporter family substrate-binding protein [Corynebacterium sp.]
MKTRLLPALLLAASLSACAANPGPPPVEEPEPTPESTTSVAPETTTPEVPSRGDQIISVGIDPLPAGFNPHLQAHDSTFTRSLGSLVLPSTFRDGVMDFNLLESAGEVQPAPGTVAQTVRFVISAEAQWSDGTPITGADFRYLWQGMTQTPGVINPAGYRAIEGIRTSADGRTVDVDFRTPVVDWREMFDNLLPSHVLQGDVTRFGTGFDNGVPASAGRYAVENVDRSRGVVTLNRNDRFWGSDPAATDRVRFQEIRSVTQGVEQLRSGQLNFLDTVPGETSVDSYRLMRDTQVRLVDQPRELTLTMSVTSPLLADQAVRAELHALLDVPLIARLAAGRSAELSIPEHAATPGVPSLLPEVTGEQGRPLRIGVDPADDTSLAAARTIVDLLSQSDVRAEMVTSDLEDLTGVQLPDGEVDAVIVWQRIDSGALDLAGHWECPPSPQAPRSGNLSGYCTEETAGTAAALVDGSVPLDEAAAVFAATNAREHLDVPLLGERRMLVLGEGIVGPDPDLENWTAGVSTVASWRKP